MGTSRDPEPEEVEASRRIRDQQQKHRANSNLRLFSEMANMIREGGRDDEAYALFRSLVRSVTHKW